MLYVLHDDHAFRFVDPVQDAPLGTETRAVDASQLASQRPADPVWRLQERPGYELDGGCGYVLRE
jgi:hypothetical protein